MTAAPVAAGRRDALRLASMLAALTAIGLARPLLPVDETRYAAVAWEMWWRGDFVLPRLNGAPYAHKPPLLFWIVQAGWATFGVNGWWPRLVSPLFAAATLALTHRLGRLLWPARPEVAGMAPFILLASLLYAYFASALMFDAMLTAFVALACVGLATAWRAGGSGGHRRGFVLVAAGLTGALYAKGPVALAHVLPIALAAPWWMRTERPPSWRRWYTALAVATLAAAAAILAWALPAAAAGGDAYARAIFWGQTAGRVADSFAHQAPWYTYAVSLPLLLAPWFLWPRVWTGLRGALRPAGADSGLRFTIVGLVFCLLLFSAVSGKRWHYLLPEFPLFALLAARALVEAPAGGRWRLAVPGATLAAFGAVAIGAAPRLAERLGGPELVPALQAAGIVALAAGASLGWRAPASAAADVRRVATAMLTAVLALLVAADLTLRDSHDVQALAERLAAFEREGRPLAMEGEYAGQWTFAGRLRRPLDEVPTAAVAGWLAAHPQGRLVFTYARADELPVRARIVEDRPWRGARLAVLAAP